LFCLKKRVTLAAWKTTLKALAAVKKLGDKEAQ
jgi:hypothetical protein